MAGGDFYYKCMLFHGTEIIECDVRWPQLARRLGFEDYSAIIEYSGNLWSESSLTRVHRLNPDPSVWPGGIFLKKVVPNAWYRFFLRPAKCSIEAKNYCLLRRLGILVPEVLAVGERRKYGGLIDAFIITSGIANAVNLEEFAKRSDAADFMPAILDQLADIVGTMHGANFFHIDLQWRNILVQEMNGEVMIYLIDCPRGGRRWEFFRRWNGRLHDLAGLDKLAGLYLSPKQRLKWFKQYAGGGKFRWQDRLLIRRIVRRIEFRRQRRNDEGS